MYINELQALRRGQPPRTVQITEPRSFFANLAKSRPRPKKPLARQPSLAASEPAAGRTKQKRLAVAAAAAAAAQQSAPMSIFARKTKRDHTDTEQTNTTLTEVVVPDPLLFGRRNPGCVGVFNQYAHHSRDDSFSDML